MYCSAFLYLFIGTDNVNIIEISFPFLSGPNLLP